MRLFGRNKNVEQVPSEVQDYYRSERRERVGLAWLLALGTLVVTLIIAAGLFFGGRWTYRKITGNDNKTPQTAQQDQNQNGQTSSTNTDQSNNDQQKNEGQNNGQNGSTSSPSPAPAPTPTPTPTPAPQGSGSGPAPNPAPAPTPTPSPTPVAAASTTDPRLANTGPGDTIALFVIVSIAGAVAHRMVWARYRQ
jgi:cytoskeletal protein RodZ